MSSHRYQAVTAELEWNGTEDIETGDNQVTDNRVVKFDSSRKTTCVAVIYTKHAEGPKCSCESAMVFLAFIVLILMVSFQLIIAHEDCGMDRHGPDWLMKISKLKRNS